MLGVAEPTAFVLCVCVKSDQPHAQITTYASIESLRMVDYADSDQPSFRILVLIDCVSLEENVPLFLVNRNA